MKFVIIIKVNRELLTDGVGEGFRWEVRELLKTADRDGDLLERTGPGLASGVAPDVTAAKAAAEDAARKFAAESIYVFDTAV
jgi:hypothetical protein